MNFLRLVNNHAQYEIRVYADIMLNTVKMGPITYEAFMDYRVEELRFQPKENYN